VNCCALANNHVLDWGYTGLAETLDTLKANGVRIAGAGRNLAEAQAPADLEVPGKGRVLVFSFGATDSGIPPNWAATRTRPGVHLLDDLSPRTVGRIAAIIMQRRRARDLIVASIHWGGNWGYEIDPGHRAFAHALVEEAGVDLVHGHSSHHARGMELWRGKLILYGCGDFINDYEGIGGFENFRPDLTLMYFPTLDLSTGRLRHVSMSPMKVRRLQARHASRDDTRWLADTLDRESAPMGMRIAADEGDRLRWSG
jgi:poly-gamma-glutamate synthesis protein (capsule biosynthesis protein)